MLARNPVHSVLWLILAFFSAAGLMVLLGAEFIAMILVIVYVGAVMVLFLFVVMMLDVDFAELKSGFVSYLPLGRADRRRAGGRARARARPLDLRGERAGRPDRRDAGCRQAIPNTQALGLILYDGYILIFQLAGLILLVAMIGAIVLTLRHRTNVKRQDVLAQIYRGRDVELKDVEPGQGV